jgi:ADP-heptose:LPS heptosyltransferase
VIPPFLEIPITAQSWWKKRVKEIPDLSDGYVCIHPGGFYRTQRWPIDRFYRLAERIQEELGKTVVWCRDTGSEAGNSFKSPLSPDPWKVIPFSGLALDQLAAVVGNAQLFIGNNSGPLHLACALATPTVSMMGPTVPHRWWPIGENHQVLRLGVACSPCSLGQCSHHTCLRALDVDRVYQVVEASVNETRYPDISHKYVS